MGAPPEFAILARGLVKRYGDLTALDGLDLEVRRGTCLGLLGPNGAGKTTTIEVLEGLKRADAGEVELLGLRWDRDPREIRERIGVQLQETQFQDKLTVFEVLRLFRSFYRRGAELAEILGVIHLEEKRDVQVGKLSGGQKQRLAIGCALLNEPEVLFLDEPSTGLDPQARRRVWEVVEHFKERGGTVLLTTHYMEEAERLADDLVIVERGKVIARGSPGGIVATLEAEAVVEFSLDGADPRTLTEAELRAVAGVRSVRYEGASVALSVSATQAAVAGLFDLVTARDLTLVDLRTHRPTLEDVFVSLTGKHLRDG